MRYIPNCGEHIHETSFLKHKHIPQHWAFWNIWVIFLNLGSGNVLANRLKAMFCKLIKGNVLANWLKAMSGSSWLSLQRIQLPLQHWDTKWHQPHKKLNFDPNFCRICFEMISNQCKKPCMHTISFETKDTLKADIWEVFPNWRPLFWKAPYRHWLSINVDTRRSYQDYIFAEKWWACSFQCTWYAFQCFSPKLVIHIKSNLTK